MAAYPPRRRVKVPPAPKPPGAAGAVGALRQAKLAATAGPKVVPPGVKNYGQLRSQQVHERNAARKAVRVNTISGKPLPKPPKPRFGANELVDRGTAQRTMSRIRRLGPKAPGGKYGVGLLSGGITGSEARKARTMVADERPAIRNTPIRRRRRPTPPRRPITPPGLARKGALEQSLGDLSERRRREQALARRAKRAKGGLRSGPAPRVRY